MAHIAEYDNESITLTNGDKVYLTKKKHGELIHSYDIGVILGNAVDNAMEACRKLKAKEPEAGAFIRLSSWRNQPCLHSL